MVRIYQRTLVLTRYRDQTIWHIRAAGLSTDEKPTEGVATGSQFIEVDTGDTYRYDEAAEAWRLSPGGEGGADSRVSSLDQTPLAAAGGIIEAVGIPAYIDSGDLSDYAAYGLTDTGWYLFARISAPDGVTVSAETAVTGAAGSIAALGADHVDVAVKFDVAAVSEAVTVTWAAGQAETFVFKATDLAVRNLDYRTTFYVYDAADYAEWSYNLVPQAGTATTFDAKKAYFTLEDGAYTPAEVTAGSAIPAYYTESGGTYTQATGVFQDGVTYYTRSGDTYTAATVTAGEAIPAYYDHSKVTFSGMVKNVTYRFDTPIDCQIEFVLPEIAEDGHGAWYEFHFQHTDQHSLVMTPPTGVKGAAVQGSATATAGINVVDLHYTYANGTKLWTLLNTHTNIPA